MNVPYYLSFSLLRSNSIDIAADFDYNDNCIPYSILLDPGRYFFEAWGAAGGNYGENGGYTAGTIDFSTRTQLYAIVGGMGEMPVKEVRNTKGGCGGGGKGGAPASTNYYSGAGGGGATTVYYQNYSTDNRILVSGGGGAFKALERALRMVMHAEVLQVMQVDLPLDMDTHIIFPMEELRQ